ncbi:MAG: nucleotidyltransferase family protein [Gammaproteobacteria bacterium]|nr:nucleotidyltransferase family protein [Gammaproteobacteria bacterium]
MSQSRPDLPSQAIVLAAGRGERLRPLTDRIPKPMVEIEGRPLIDHHLSRLARAGVSLCVINVAHLGLQIEAHVGDGGRFGLEVRYSREPEGALETGGGIRQALGMLRPGPFLAVNADVLTDFDFTALRDVAGSLAHLVLVPNPPANPGGDFCLQPEGRVSNAPTPRLTFSGIACYEPALLAAAPAAGRFPLTPWLRAAAEQGRVSGQIFEGSWFDIGTPERLAVARQWARRAGLQFNVS